MFRHIKIIVNKMENKRLHFLFTSLLLTSFISFCSGSINPTITGTVDKELEEVIAVGINVYEANCAKCHKSELQGADNWKTDRDEDGHRLAPPLNGYGHSWHHSPEKIFNTIRYGLVYFGANYEGKMNANDKLTDEEIWSVIEYMYSVWPEDVQSEYNEMFLSN
jgi:mono/diheme cytochrome c family protein